MPSAYLARRRRPDRFAKLARRTAAPTEDDLLAGLDPVEFVKAADAILRADAPKPSPATAERWVRPVRRWLASLAEATEEAIDAFERRAIRRSVLSFIRRAGPSDFEESSIAWARLERELAGVVSDLYEDVGAEALEAVADDVGVAINPGLRETLSEGVRDAIGRDVRQITESSRNDLADAVQTAIQRRYSVEQLTRGVKGDGFAGLRGIVDRWQAVAPVATTTDRAHLIALTETARAYNLGTLNAYAASGLVEMVNVFDGEGCGWTTHTDPEAANGKRVPIAEARANPLSHPHCQRAFGAVVAGAPPAGAPGGQVVPRPQVGPQAGPRTPVETNARAIQARVFNEAREAEPETTALLQGLEAQGVGRLEGIAYRLKADNERTVDKILGDLADGAPIEEAAKVRDALRYTFMHDRGTYWQSATTVHGALRAAGYKPIKWQNNWPNPLNKDVNTAWRSPSGTRFELQFHTPESFARKNTAGPWGRASHKAYEEYRALRPEETERKAQLVEELTSIWRGIEGPLGDPFLPEVFPDI